MNSKRIWVEATPYHLSMVSNKHIWFRRTFLEYEYYSKVKDFEASPRRLDSVWITNILFNYEEKRDCYIYKPFHNFYWAPAKIYPQSMYKKKARRLSDPQSP